MKSRRSQHLSPIHSPPSDGDSPKEQDRFLPIANVSRIMKRSLPANAKISKEAKETVQECVSEFISFITGEASDKCQREKRKTINGDDLLWAMTTLGFDKYVGPLKLYLNKYRETEGEKSMTRQGDQQYNSCNGEGSNCNMISSASLSGLSGSGFYPVGTAPAGMQQDYGGDDHLGRISSGGGDGNGGRALPGLLHGLQW
ncbi:nuclear transcription factor Y subunit B-1-like [Typha angustifolia]|uniref:nuclear transcription factor Y subunit B-1-like n=1 Tax=Typha angustifolia TaxID=59011 RepID=UPI003C2C12DD